MTPTTTLLPAGRAMTGAAARPATEAPRNVRRDRDMAGLREVGVGRCTVPPGRPRDKRLSAAYPRQQPGRRGRALSGETHMTYRLCFAAAAAALAAAAGPAAADKSAGWTDLVGDRLDKHWETEGNWTQGKDGV